MNTVNLVGRLGQDPELKTSKSGTSFVKFSIATNDGFGDNKKTNWHNCTAFGKGADIIAKYVKKGSEIAVSGSIDYNKHEDKFYTSILVDKFTFVGGKSESSAQPAPSAPFEPVGDLNEDDESGLPF